MKQAQAAGEEVDQEVGEYGTLLYNMGLLNSGFLIEDPSGFVAPMQKLLKVGFGLRRDAPVEEIEVDIGGDDETDEAAQETPEEPDVEGEAEVEDENSSSTQQQRNDEL